MEGHVKTNKIYKRPITKGMTIIDLEGLNQERQNSEVSILYAPRGSFSF